jgi:hypothetical protein
MGFLGESRAQNPELTGLRGFEILNLRVLWWSPGLQILNSRAWGAQNPELAGFLGETRAQNSELMGLGGSTS